MLVTAMLAAAVFQDGLSKEPVLPLRGMALSERHKLLFTVQPGGGVRAIDLPSGAVKWKTREAEWPIAVSGSTLVAAKGGSALAIVGLDLLTGQKRFGASLRSPQGTPQDFGVYEAGAPSPQARFPRIVLGETTVLTEGRILVSWHSPPRPSGVRQLRIGPELGGYALVDTSNGTVQELPLGSPTVKKLVDGAHLRPVSERSLSVRFGATDATQVVHWFPAAGGVLQTLAQTLRYSTPAMMRIQWVPPGQTEPAWSLPLAPVVSWPFPP